MDKKRKLCVRKKKKAKAEEMNKWQKFTGKGEDLSSSPQNPHRIGYSTAKWEAKGRPASSYMKLQAREPC